MPSSFGCFGHGERHSLHRLVSFVAGLGTSEEKCTRRTTRDTATCALRRPCTRLRIWLRNSLTAPPLDEVDHADKPIQARHGRSSLHRVSTGAGMNRHERSNSRCLRAEDRAARHDPKPRPPPVRFNCLATGSLGGRACAVRTSPVQAERACRTPRRRRRRRPRSGQ